VKTFLVEIHCATPEEILASLIPDEHFNHFASILYDQQDRESCAYYRANWNHKGKSIAPQPCISLTDDGFYTQEERKEIYPTIENIIAQASAGIRRIEHHLITLPKKFNQQDFSKYARYLERNPFFRTVNHYVHYLHVPEQLAQNTGFPEEKIKLHEDGKERLYRALKRE